MEKLKKKEGIIYTQNIEELPIEERIFTSGGVVVKASDYRPATAQELKEWEEYQGKQEEMFHKAEES